MRDFSKMEEFFHLIFQLGILVFRMTKKLHFETGRVNTD